MGACMWLKREVEILPEHWLTTAVDTLVRLVEATGVLIIFIGALLAALGFLRALPRRDPDSFVPVRLTLARFLALGLEFQLASDILRTAIAPSSRSSASWPRWLRSGQPSTILVTRGWEEKEIMARRDASREQRLTRGM